MAADLSFLTGVGGASRAYTPAARKNDNTLASATDTPIIEISGPVLGTLTDTATPDIGASGASRSVISLLLGAVANLLAISGKLPASLGLKAAAASLPVVLASDQAVLAVDTVVKTTAVSRSGTIASGGSAQQFMAANATRRGFTFQNQSTGDLYISGIASATADQNSLKIGPGDYYESSAQHVGVGAMSIIGATTGQAFYAREF